MSCPISSSSSPPPPSSSNVDKDGDKEVYQSSDTTLPTCSRAKILLLGDSITQQSFSAIDSGWGAHLADVYQRRADVINRGYAGYNTTWFLQLIQTNRIGHNDVFDSSSCCCCCCSNHHPHDREIVAKGGVVRLVTVWFGANDASDPKLNPRHHVPLHRYRTNLKTIVALCRQHFGSRVKIIIICPPPVHHASRLQYQISRYGIDKATGKLERTLKLSGMYAKAAQEVALELNLPCLNVWRSMQDAEPSSSLSSLDGDNDDCGDHDQPWSKYLSDGLHLSREGNIFVGKALVELINRTIPELAVHPCPMTGFCGNSASKCLGLHQIGPWHDEIDNDNPEQAFERYEEELACERRIKKEKSQKDEDADEG